MPRKSKTEAVVPTEETEEKKFTDEKLEASLNDSPLADEVEATWPTESVLLSASTWENYNAILDSLQAFVGDQWETHNGLVSIPAHLQEAIQDIIQFQTDRVRNEFYRDHDEVIVLAVDEAEAILRVAHAGELVLNRKYREVQGLEDVLVGLRHIEAGTMPDVSIA